MKCSNLTFSQSIFILIVAVSPVQSATIHVPADQPTIQTGIDAAISGDTVLVADGIYTGTGNRGIDFGGKGVVLKSENGPEVTIIDCEGSFSVRHRGFEFHSGEDSTAVVDGFTIRNGYGGQGGGISCYFSNPTISNNTISGNSAGSRGGGIFCFGSNPAISNNTITGNSAFNEGGIGGGGGISCIFTSNPTISNNTISGNSAELRGGGIFCVANSNPIISNNTISGNSSFSGGGIYCSNFSSPTINNNTISGNSASTVGAGLFLLNNSSPSVENTIFAFNSGRELIWCDDGTSVPTLSCCDVYGNSGGDWVGCIANQLGTNGNFSLDPLFCDYIVNNFSLNELSPCLPENSPCGELVGTIGLGCSGVFVCADANGDSLVNVDDVDFLINFYFYGGATPFPYTTSDLNCDGSVNIADITYLAAYINGTGAPPCCAQ